MSAARWHDHARCEECGQEHPDCIDARSQCCAERLIQPGEDGYGQAVLRSVATS